MPTDHLTPKIRPRVTEANLPNAVGWEWTTQWIADDGVTTTTQHSLVWTRPGGAPMMYSVKTNHNTEWSHIVSSHPRMIGIETLDEARKVACWFIHDEEGDRP